MNSHVMVLDVEFLDKIIGRKPCPTCGNPVGRLSGGRVCVHCDTYLMKSEHGVVPMPEDSLSDQLWFGAPLPWPDVRAVEEGATQELSVATAIGRVLTTKDEGARLLEAEWPDRCCICGAAAAQHETIGRAITIPRYKGPINVGSQTVGLVAQGIPHCGAHSGGVAFGRILSTSTGSTIPYGLLFRSLGYRNDYRRLNPCAWTLG